MGRLYFSYSHKLNCDMFTVKPYEILKVKNAMVKSVYHFSKVHHLQSCLLTEAYRRDIAA
jgi:hypothetical protein